MYSYVYIHIYFCSFAGVTFTSYKLIYGSLHVCIYGKITHTYKYYIEVYIYIIDIYIYILTNICNIYITNVCITICICIYINIHICIHMYNLSFFVTLHPILIGSQAYILGSYMQPPLALDPKLIIEPGCCLTTFQHIVQ